MINGSKIVDFFPFFGPTGKELLELRINMLKDYVDEFVICESNRTHSGLPIEYELRQCIKDFNLPAEKIKIIELDIPENENLIVTDIDRANCSVDYKPSINQENINSLRTRVIERMQKDSLLSVLDDYDENTVFIHSDSDEIIDPKNISYVVSVAISNPGVIIKIPLVLLEGRADLRTYNKDTNTPAKWDGGMFLCLKQHLLNSTPTNIRSGVKSVYPISYITENGSILQDLGWHFAWMGDKNNRQIKRKAFCHYDDKLPNVLDGSGFDSKNTDIFFENYNPNEGNCSPSGMNNTILRRYPLHKLPKEIFLLPRVKDFLLPDLLAKEIDILNETYFSNCNTSSDINEHLEDLNRLASECKHVTELGVRSGNSTSAFLVADVILRSYDIELDNKVIELFKIAKEKGKDVEYIQGDDRIINIEETDLLFIDTYHSYDQLKIELERHHDKVRKYIVLHDTFIHAIKGHLEGEIGLLPALIEFMIKYPQWTFKMHKINNSGLTVIERKNELPVTRKIIDKVNDLQSSLDSYIMDPRNPELNFNLGYMYEKDGQNSSALSFYLRSAEYSTDKLLQYESLLKVALCVERSGNRIHTLKGLYLRAISILPDRPEGYFLLSKLYENTKEWNECYTMASIGESSLPDNPEELKTDIGYPGKYGLTFERAVSGWWIGLFEESYLLLKKLEKNKDITDIYRTAVNNNLTFIYGLEGFIKKE